jgi:hypothetical protein
MTTEQLANPYFELLGIPESEFPPNRYRLLGIPPFTSNETVIRNGAARQMQFLRRVGGEKYIDDVQTILNEVAEAKIFLLNDECRNRYDEEIRELISPGESRDDIPSTGLVTVTITQLDGHDAGKVHEFGKDRIVVGSGPVTDVNLDGLKKPLVIRRHQNQWFVESATNVFAVNQTIIEDRAILKSGDVIRSSISDNTIQFRIGNEQERMSYWLEKYPHCRVDPLPEILPDPKWKRKPDPASTRNVPTGTSSKKFVKKTESRVSTSMVIFCIIAGCSIGAIAYLLIRILL